jgi:hypothetical protein
MTPPQPKLPPVDLAALAVLNKEYPGLFNTVFYAVEQGKKIKDDHRDGRVSVVLMMTFRLRQHQQAGSITTPSRSPWEGRDDLCVACWGMRARI